MKEKHESFLKACLGENGFSSLSKAINRQGLDGPSNLQDTYYALMVVPRSLLSWVSSVLKGMQNGANMEVEIPGGNSAFLHVDKFKNDIYSGYIYRGGETIHRFADVTIPSLASHLMTVLELYDDFKDNGMQDSSVVINNLVPLIDKMVAERLKAAPQPVINININNENEIERKEEKAPFVPSLPVMKEEPDAVEKTDSFKAGYHMTLGNFFRGKGNKEVAKTHDESLHKYVKGKYSGLNKEEFAAGIKKAADCIKSDMFEKDEEDESACEDKPTDQYEDEREKLKDEGDREEEEEAKQKLVSKTDMVPTPKMPTMPKINIGAPKMAMPMPSSPPKSGTTAPENAAPKSSTPGYAKNEKDWEMTKSDMEARCPDCGGREFIDEKFVGCICMGDMRSSKLKVVKNENGNYKLEFGKGWEEENVELLLEILKKRNNNG